jgi:hypothetical protein
MIRRSLSCDWTEEDRLTRAKWMRTMAIFYGCIALVVFAAIAVIKPSSIAPAGAADRQTRAPDMHRGHSIGKASLNKQTQEERPNFR